MLSRGGQTGKAGEQLIDEMLKAGDVDGDGRFDLWEIAAHTLGRRKTPVELLIYDISNGLSSKLSPLLLGRHFEAIYHTSVVVFGEEYWFGGKIFKNSPPCTRCFGRPLTRSRVRLEASEYFPDLRVVRMGHTLATSEEFHRHLDLETRLDFTPASYDILTHNCNSFTNEAMMFLTGHGIPEEIKRLPELVTNTPTVKLLRPFLNRWLGGFDAYDSQEARRCELRMFSITSTMIREEVQLCTNLHCWCRVDPDESRCGSTVVHGGFVGDVC